MVPSPSFTLCFAQAMSAPIAGQMLGGAITSENKSQLLPNRQSEINRILITYADIVCLTSLYPITLKMSRKWTPPTRRFWDSVYGAFTEEFPAVSRGAGTR
jgi:hypothetical protein